MIIQTKRYDSGKIRKLRKHVFPAILTKKDGSCWLVTGTKRKKLKFLRFIKKEETIEDGSL